MIDIRKQYHECYRLICGIEDYEASQRNEWYTSTEGSSNFIICKLASYPPRIIGACYLARFSINNLYPYSWGWVNQERRTIWETKLTEYRRKKNTRTYRLIEVEQGER